MKTILLKLHGMTCASCVSNIESHLNDAEGVTEALVNFANEKAQVTFDAEIISVEGIIGVVKQVGYDADVIGGDDFEEMQHGGHGHHEHKGHHSNQKQ